MLCILLFFWNFIIFNKIILYMHYFWCLTENWCASVKFISIFPTNFFAYNFITKHFFNFENKFVEIWNFYDNTVQFVFHVDMKKWYIRPKCFVTFKIGFNFFNFQKIVFMLNLEILIVLNLKYQILFFLDISCYNDIINIRFSNKLFDQWIKSLIY